MEEKMANTYFVKWSDGTTAEYETISEIVADVITELAEEEIWGCAGWWAKEMENGNFQKLTEEQALKSLIMHSLGIEAIKAIYDDDIEVEYTKE